MKSYTVAIQIIRDYHLTIDAESEEEAMSVAQHLSTDEIEDRGSHQETNVDYAEILGGGDEEEGEE